MFACSLALIVQEFPAGERAVAFGLYGATNGLSVALGPILGGVLVQAFGWQAIFYVNVPIAIVAFVILQRKVVNLPGPPTQDRLARPRSPSPAPCSWRSSRRSAATTSGWTSALILGCYAVSAILFVAFVAIELRRKFPMFDLGLFRNPTFVGSSVSAFTVCFSVLALIFFLTTWLQSILGYSAVGNRPADARVHRGGADVRAARRAHDRDGQPADRAHRSASRWSSCGVLSMTAVSSSSSWTAILPGLVLAGVGLGLINPTLASTAVSVVPPWRGGMASGMNSTCREAGTTAGIAVLGRCSSIRSVAHVHNTLAGSPLAHHRPRPPPTRSRPAGHAELVRRTPTVVPARHRRRWRT